MRKLLWFLLVLAVLAVGADRAADWFAEGTVATRLESSQDLPQRPDVAIAGFPFLTQLYAGRFDRVTASLEDVEVGRGEARAVLAGVEVDFRDVRTDRSLRRFEAATGRATATMGYAELGRLTGLRVSWAGQGRVRATRDVSIAGERLSPGVTVDPALVLRVVREAVGLDVPSGALPFDLRIRSLTATEDGLRLRLTGRDVSYER